MSNTNTNANGTLEVFWKEALQSYSAPTPLSVDKAFQSNQLHTHKRKQIKIDSRAVNELLELSKRVSVNLETIIVSMWGILLNRYSREDDVLFGLVNGVNVGKTNPITPILINNSEGQRVGAWLRKNETNLKNALEVGNEPLDRMKEWSSIPKNTPLLESVLVLEERGFFDEISDQAFALLLYVEIESEIKIEIRYSEDRFSNETIDRLMGHIRQILTVIPSGKIQRLGEICILPEIEFRQMVVEWNDTEVDYPNDKCLHELFENQVSVDPLAIAVIFQSEKLTYGELNAKANQLARYLQKNGAKPGKLVAISLPRGLNMVIGLMAILKSGAAYVPLDPSYPKERLKYMMSDTKAPILLTDSSLLEQFPAHSAKTILMDEYWGEIGNCDEKNLDVDVCSADLAYVIYTSGSTGRPKGAVLNHQGRVNNFCDFNRRYSIGSGDRILCLASISFDMSAYDVFGTLMCGGCLIVADSTSILGATNWSKLMTEHKITVWHSVPALMEMLVNNVEENSDSNINHLRLVLLGGDWIPVALPDRLRTLNSEIQVVSMGGATECSMDSTIYDVTESSSEWKSIPYGFPMANQKTYVLDKNLLPLPIGVAGELHLGGVGVGEGYLNRCELSSEKFITNPFKCDEKIYKTGDLARFGEDGNLELLGRIDFQVKIRGFRIELGEVESSLRKHAAVRECVVLSKLDNTKTNRLVAYVLLDEEYQNIGVEETEETQIEQWQAVYDSAYSNAEDLKDETFNIVSWDSSYTSEPYSEEVMKIWVKSTVERITKNNPKSVLEIGCGTGLLLLRIAPNCERYTGTDISQVALDHVATQKEKLNLPQIELYNCSGEDFSKLDFDNYCAVVLNSIVMDFPNINYLTKVIEGAVKRIKKNGLFFIGDVRDINSLRAFHTSIQLHRSRSSVSVSEMGQIINRQMLIEEEMLIDPRYFIALADRIREISGVSIQLKRGKDNNEMSKFRYDVALYINSERIEKVNNWIEWDGQPLAKTDIANIVGSMAGKPIGIRNVVNSRNLRDFRAIDWIKQVESEASKLNNVRELRKVVKDDMKKFTGIDPEVFWAYADPFNIEVEIHYSYQNNSKLYDVVFKPKGCYNNICTGLTLDKNCQLDDYANNPLREKTRRRVISELRRHLSDTLPSYMVPAAFIIMDNFPLSPNGKLNRKALPEPDNLRPIMSEEYQAPRDDVESVLCDIWSQCLNIGQIGIKDGFLALGGNSLMATQVVSRIREIFQLELPISYGFNSTVEQLSKLLAREGTANGVEVSEAANVYLQISSMSENEINEMLNSN